MTHPPSKLVTHPAACADVGRDMGRVIHDLPCGVVRPTSVEDVVETIRWCREHEFSVVARGQGHTAFGQAQVRAGVVLDMRSFSRIHAIEADRVTVDAGITWRELVTETIPRGRMPPVLTAFQGLSVGGTLSVGGLSGCAYKRGTQVDHVLAMDVITGTGRLVTCSPEIEPELFHAVLGGLGQCAIITRVVLPLVPAPERVHHATLTYRSHAPFLRELATLARREQLDGLSGTIYPADPGGPRYDLNGFLFGGAESAAATSERLRSMLGQAVEITEHRLLDFYLQVDRLIDELEVERRWSQSAHPWFDVFLPEEQLESWMSETIPALRGEDVGPPELGALGQAHLFPLRRSLLRRPLLRVPESEWVYLFDILSSSHQPAVDQPYVERMLARNRRLYERARESGGTVYPIAAIPFGPEDWAQHWGGAFEQFLAQKRLHDPDHILATGLRMFAGKVEP